MRGGEVMTEVQLKLQLFHVSLLLCLPGFPGQRGSDVFPTQGIVCAATHTQGGSLRSGLEL